MAARTASARHTLLERFSVFGPPPLIGGEDAAAYDELLARFSVAIKPTDALEEMWLRDVVDLTWETLRMRRLKRTLLASAMLDQLNSKYEPEELLHRWAARDPDAIEEVDRLLASDGLTVDDVAAKAFSNKIWDFERIDRTVMNAEARRNAALRELERHRETLARDLRQTSDNVAEADYEDVTPVRRRLAQVRHD
jgi:hypothetical protein